MVGIISIAQRLTWVISYKSTNTMLSRLFATEACYTIKETNKNKKSHFAEASYHFHLSYHFVSEN